MATNILPVTEGFPIRGRASIAWDACSEVEVLCNVLMNQAGTFANPDHLVVRGLAMRIRQLSQIGMNALDEKTLGDNSHLNELLRGLGVDIEDENPERRVER